MKLTKQITWQGHRWNEIGIDQPGSAHFILKRPVSLNEIKRGNVFASAISVPMLPFFKKLDKRVPDEVIRLLGKHITEHMHANIGAEFAVQTDVLEAFCFISVDSRVSSQLDHQHFIEHYNAQSNTELPAKKEN